MCYVPIMLVFFAILLSILTIIASSTTIVIHMLIYYRIWNVVNYNPTLHDTTWRRSMDGIVNERYEIGKDGRRLDCETCAETHSSYSVFDKRRSQ